jgi:2-polyprenyl-6-methoxyphenol hydroxylase-like FAD-dependent oxidoreductase
MDTTEVLIVGAGPVGLSLALECARHDVGFKIIDASPRPSDKSKALAIWSAAQETFSAMGVLEDMRREAFLPDGIRFCTPRRTLLRIPSGKYVDSPHPDVVLLPQSSTERILGEKLQQRGHHVIRPLELMALSQDGQGVTATLQHPEGQRETCRCSYLVGCDGAHSAARHLVGSAFEGKAHPDCFILCDARVSGKNPLPPEVLIYLSKRGVLPMFPIRENLWRIISTRDPAAGTAPPLLEEMQEHLDERGPGGLQLSKPEWLSCFRISERKVKNFRVGRVLLAGDAAHIHSPAGGQGMNTGVQDAFNLGWKLGLILRKSGNAEALLDSYHTERSPVAEKVITEASLRTKIGLLTGGPMAGLRNLGAMALGHSDRFIKKFAVNFSGVAMTYGKSPALGTGGHWDEDWQSHGFAVGHRMRDAIVENEELPVSLLSVLLGSTKHVLVLFSGLRPNYRDVDLLEGIRQSAAGFSSLVSTLALWRGDHTPDDSWLLDADGSAHRKFGAGNPSVYLIRPDGYVAERSQPADFKPIAQLLAALR